MKKNLTLALVLVLCSLFCFGALAFEAETVESASETIPAAEQTEPTALSGSIDVTIDDNLTHPSYGTLVYYNDFETATKVGADIPHQDGAYYIDNTILGAGVTFGIYAGNSTLTLEADPTGSTNKVLKIKNHSDYYRAVLKPSTSITKQGIYTVVMDFYVPDTNPNARIYSLTYLNR